MEFTCTANNTLNLTDPDRAAALTFNATAKLIVQVIIPIISFVGIVANSSFLFSCFRSKELRNSTVTIYLANLAVCDILFLVMTNFWYALLFIISKNRPINWSVPVSSVFGCSMLYTTVFVWYSASLAFISFISLERYYAICHPVKYRSFQKKKRVLISVIGSWALSIILTPTLVVDAIRFSTECILWPDTAEFQHLPTTFNTCGPLNNAANIYGHLFFLISFTVTLIVNCVFFGKIILALYRSSRNVNTIDRVRNQITRTLIANGIVFFLCQLPFRIYTLDSLLDSVDSYDFLASPELEQTFITASRAFLLLNSIINPFLYVSTSQHYRRAMIEAFCGKRCEAREDATSPSADSRKVASVSDSSGTTKDGSTTMSMVSLN